MNLKKYVLLSFLTSFSMFACFNPTYYAGWPDKLQARKEIVPGQTMRVTLPPELVEAKDEIQKAISESFDKITRSETTQIEQSGKIKDGSSWKITFKKNENTKKIDCKLNFQQKNKGQS